MVFNRLFRRKKKKELKLPRSIFLKAKPIRNPELKWVRDRKTREIKITVPLRSSSSKEEKKGIISKLFPPEPREKIIRLDKIGSIVWELCDGERTIGDIANYLVEKYKLMPEEAEISLNVYFNNLSKRGLIGLLFPKEVKKFIKEEEFTKEPK